MSVIEVTSLLFLSCTVALCLMLSKTYHAQNFAGMIGLGLIMRPFTGCVLVVQSLLSFVHVKLVISYLTLMEKTEAIE